MELRLNLEQQEHLYETLLLSIESHDHVLSNHQSEDVKGHLDNPDAIVVSSEDHVQGIAYELRRKQVLTEIKAMLEE